MSDVAKTPGITKPQIKDQARLIYQKKDLTSPLSRTEVLYKFEEIVLLRSKIVNICDIARL